MKKDVVLNEIKDELNLKEKIQSKNIHKIYG